MAYRRHAHPRYPRRPVAKTYTIEPGGHGETYHRTTGYTVYGHDTYPPHSVLAGSPRRTWEGHFDTIEAARAAFPAADLIAGTTHIPVDVLTAHLPDEPDY